MRAKVTEYGWGTAYPVARGDEEPKRRTIHPVLGELVEDEWFEIPENFESVARMLADEGRFELDEVQEDEGE